MQAERERERSKQGSRQSVDRRPQKSAAEPGRKGEGGRKEGRWRHGAPDELVPGLFTVN